MSIKSTQIRQILEHTVPSPKKIQSTTTATFSSQSLGKNPSQNTQNVLWVHQQPPHYQQQQQQMLNFNYLSNQQPEVNENNRNTQMGNIQHQKAASPFTQHNQQTNDNLQNQGNLNNNSNPANSHKLTDILSTRFSSGTLKFMRGVQAPLQQNSPFQRQIQTETRQIEISPSIVTSSPNNFQNAGASIYKQNIVKQRESASAQQSLSSLQQIQSQFGQQQASTSPRISQFAQEKMLQNKSQLNNNTNNNNNNVKKDQSAAPLQKRQKSLKVLENESDSLGWSVVSNVVINNRNQSEKNLLRSLQGNQQNTQQYSLHSSVNAFPNTNSISTNQTNINQSSPHISSSLNQHFTNQHILSTNALSSSSNLPQSHFHQQNYPTFGIPVISEPTSLTNSIKMTSGFNNQSSQQGKAESSFKTQIGSHSLEKIRNNQDIGERQDFTKLNGVLYQSQKFSQKKNGAITTTVEKQARSKKLIINNNNGNNINPLTQSTNSLSKQLVQAQQIKSIISPNGVMHSSTVAAFLQGSQQLSKSAALTAISQRIQNNLNEHHQSQQYQQQHQQFLQQQQQQLQQQQQSQQQQNQSQQFLYMSSNQGSTSNSYAIKALSDHQIIQSPVENRSFPDQNNLERTITENIQREQNQMRESSQGKQERVEETRISLSDQLKINQLLENQNELFPSSPQFESIPKLNSLQNLPFISTNNGQKKLNDSTKHCQLHADNSTKHCSHHNTEISNSNKNRQQGYFMHEKDRTANKKKNEISGKQRKGEKSIPHASSNSAYVPSLSIGLNEVAVNQSTYAQFTGGNSINYSKQPGNLNISQSIQQNNQSVTKTIAKYLQKQGGFTKSEDSRVLEQSLKDESRNNPSEKRKKLLPQNHEKRNSLQFFKKNECYLVDLKGASNSTNNNAQQKLGEDASILNQINFYSYQIDGREGREEKQKDNTDFSSPNHGTNNLTIAENCFSQKEISNLSHRKSPNNSKPPSYQHHLPQYPIDSNKQEDLYKQSMLLNDKAKYFQSLVNQLFLKDSEKKFSQRESNDYTDRGKTNFERSCNKETLDVFNNAESPRIKSYRDNFSSRDRFIVQKLDTEEKRISNAGYESNLNTNKNILPGDAAAQFCKNIYNSAQKSASSAKTSENISPFSLNKQIRDSLASGVGGTVIYSLDSSLHQKKRNQLQDGILFENNQNLSSLQGKTKHILSGYKQKVETQKELILEQEKKISDLTEELTKKLEDFSKQQEQISQLQEERTESLKEKEELKKQIKNFQEIIKKQQFTEDNSPTNVKVVYPSLSPPLTKKFTKTGRGGGWASSLQLGGTRHSMPTFSKEFLGTTDVSNEKMSADFICNKNEASLDILKQKYQVNYNKGKYQDNKVQNSNYYNKKEEQDEPLNDSQEVLKQISSKSKIKQESQKQQQLIVSETLFSYQQQANPLFSSPLFQGSFQDLNENDCLESDIEQNPCFGGAQEDINSVQLNTQQDHQTQVNRQFERQPIQETQKFENTSFSNNLGGNESFGQNNESFQNSFSQENRNQLGTCKNQEFSLNQISNHQVEKNQSFELAIQNKQLQEKSNKEVEEESNEKQNQWNDSFTNDFQQCSFNKQGNQQPEDGQIAFGELANGSFAENNQANSESDEQKQQKAQPYEFDNLGNNNKQEISSPNDQNNHLDQTEFSLHCNENVNISFEGQDDNEGQGQNISFGNNSFGG